MAIKQTELVTLNGQTTAFGGRIYNVNYQIGFNQSASSVTLSIINESGIYNVSPDDMSIIGSPDTISFGNKELKMSPVEYSIDQGSGGKILTVRYFDRSRFYLDKKFVILNGIHSPSKTNAPSQALMILGEKYYSVEKQAEDGLYVQDYSTTPPNIYDLGKSLYTVEELYNVMVEHDIPMHSSVKNILLNKDGATDYLSSPVGTLRSVLLSWANLMAFAFYWGEDNKLHLIDLEGDINVDLDKLENIIPFSNEESYSLEETVDRGFSLYYGKQGKAQTESVEGTSKTSFFFKRGIQNYDSTIELSLEAKHKLNMIKAAALGEAAFFGYTLWITYKFSPKYDGLFGVKNIRSAQSTNSTTYPKQFEYIDEDDEYDTDTYALIEYETVDTKYPFSFFNDILNKLLTYEIAMKESDREGFNSWSVQFNYDYEDDTDFINPNNGSISGKDDPSHRAYFTASTEWAFDFSNIVGFESEVFIPIDFSNKAEAKTKGFDTKGKKYALIKRGVNWSSISDIRYKAINKRKFKVDGFNVKSGAFNSITPRLEKIYLQEPSLNSNTIATDMQTETGGELEISLAGRSFESLANLLNESYLRDDKTFRKTFSITGITLPESIGPEDGLQSVSISNTNDKGTVSTYTVGNSFFRIPSKDIIFQRLERERFAQVITGPSFNYSIRYPR